VPAAVEDFLRGFWSHSNESAAGSGSDGRRIAIFAAVSTLLVAQPYLYSCTFGFQANGLDRVLEKTL
jgi:hypothetical protein